MGHSDSGVLPARCALTPCCSPEELVEHATAVLAQEEKLRLERERPRTMKGSIFGGQGSGFMKIIDKVRLDDE